VKFYLGIDPGKSGAMVLLNENMGIERMAKAPLIKSTKAKDEYDIPALCDILDEMTEDLDATLAVVERQQPLPAKMGGSAANYQRGFSFGMYQGLLTSRGVSYEVVAPRTWQKVMFTGVNAEDTKAASVLVAKRYWPKQDWKRTARSIKDDDGLTDAALLALYGMKTLRPTAV